MKKHFREYGTYNFTTGHSTQLSAGFKEIAPGSAHSYTTAFRDLVNELVELVSLPNADIDTLESTKAQFYLKLNHIMSDRHIVNKKLYDQLMEYHTFILR